MRNFRRKLSGAIAALLLSNAPTLADDLIIGITQYPGSFNPITNAMLAQSYVLGMTQRPITTYDHEWQLICMLCEELPTLENGLAKIEPLADGSGEGMALTYRLKDDLFWGDGTPVTSDDMVFTWEVGRHPLTGAPGQEGYKRILAIDVIDDKTFTLHADRVSYDYNSLSVSLLPAHLERAIFDAAPAEYRHRTLFDRDPTNPGLAYGPYRISAAEDGSHITLTRNEYWKGTKPAFDNITVRAIEKTAALEASLLSGELDMIAGELGLAIDQALSFDKRHGESFNVVYKPGLIFEHLEMNLDNPILADKRVRQALLYGLNREQISQQLFEGKQPVAVSSVSPLDWVYDDTVPDYAYDPGKAKALLEAAGWSELRGGIRHNASGEKLSLEIMTTAGNRTRELVQQVIQSMWRAIGVEVTIRNQPPRVFFGQTTRQREFPAMGMFAWVKAPEHLPLTTLHSSQIPTAENGWSGQNYPGYANPEMDKLIDAIERELDRDRRKQLWSRLQHLYNEDLPNLPLYWRASAFILPKWLKGVRPTGHLKPSSLWVEDWRRVDS